MAIVTSDAFLTGFVKQIYVSSVTNLLGSANIVKGSRRPQGLANPSISVVAESGPIIQNEDLQWFYANVNLYVASQRLGTYDGSTFSAISSAVINAAHGISWVNSPCRCMRQLLVDASPSPYFDGSFPEEHWLPLRFRAMVMHT